MKYLICASLCWKPRCLVYKDKIKAGVHFLQINITPSFSGTFIEKLGEGWTSVRIEKPVSTNYFVLSDRLDSLFSFVKLNSFWLRQIWKKNKKQTWVTACRTNGISDFIALRYTAKVKRAGIQLASGLASLGQEAVVAVFRSQRVWLLKRSLAFFFVLAALL